MQQDFLVADGIDTAHVIERFRSEHPQIAGIRLRDARGAVLAASGVRLGRHVPVAAPKLQLWMRSTSGGDIVLAAFPLRVGREAGLRLHAASVRSVSAAETITIELAVFIEPPRALQPHLFFA
jgi:hypothetical protein